MKLLYIVLSISLSLSYVFAAPEVSLTTTPEYPKPYSNVTLSLESYSIDITTAMISWMVNGIVVKEGRGETSLVLTTEGVGQAQAVTVVVSHDTKGRVVQKINIIPSSVTLIYEAPQSYVPFFYEGRSLPGEGAKVKVTALPEITDSGAFIPASSFSYHWYINDEYVPRVSGYGKQSATLSLDYLSTKTEIKVLITSPQGNKASEVITIVPHQILPKVYLYDELFGTRMNRPVGNRLEVTKQFSVSLEPFYISHEEEKSPLYVWLLGSLPVTPLGGRLLTLAPEKNSYGTKRLTINVDGPFVGLQRGSFSTDIIFDTRK